MLLRTLTERREVIELNPVSAGIHDDVLEASVYKALSLTGVNIVPVDMHACHRIKRSGRVMIRFKCRKQKQSVMYKRKNLHEKLNLHENQQLAYKCRQLKIVRRIHSTWFFNNVVNVKLTEHGKMYKIFHVTDIENLLETDNLEEYINNTSF